MLVRERAVHFIPDASVKRAFFCEPYISTPSAPLIGGGVTRALSRARRSGQKARRVVCRCPDSHGLRQRSWTRRFPVSTGGLPGNPPGERTPGVWLASFKLPSAVHGEVWKSTTSVRLRAPMGRFGAVKGGSIDTGSGSHVVSLSPSRGPWAVGSSGGMPSGAEDCIKMCLPLVLSPAPSRGAGCCPCLPLPYYSILPFPRGHLVTEPTSAPLNKTQETNA